MPINGSASGRPPTHIAVAKSTPPIPYHASVLRWICGATSPSRCSLATSTRPRSAKHTATNASSAAVHPMSGSLVHPSTQTDAQTRPASHGTERGLRNATTSWPITPPSTQRSGTAFMSSPIATRSAASAVPGMYSAVLAQPSANPAALIATDRRVRLRHHLEPNCRLPSMCLSASCLVVPEPTRSIRRRGRAAGGRLGFRSRA